MGNSIKYQWNIWVECKPNGWPPSPPLPSSSTGAGSNNEDLKKWSVWLHLSLYAGFIIPVFGGIIAPILIWQLKKDEVPGLDAHGKVIMNWLISSFIYGLISGLLTIVLIGYMLLMVLVCLSLIFPAIGASKANKGVVWKYPLAIEFLS